MFSRYWRYCNVKDTYGHHKIRYYRSRLATFLAKFFYIIDETPHPSVYHVVSFYLSQLYSDNMKIAECALSSIKKKELALGLHV